MRLPPPFIHKHDPLPGEDTVPYPDTVRTWTDHYLHSRLAGTAYQPYHREVIAAELRVRESWRSPDTWALAVSVASLLVSVAALLVSAFG